MRKQSSVATVVGTQYATMIRVPVMDGMNCIGDDYYILPPERKAEALALQSEGLLGSDIVGEWNLRRCRMKRF